MSKNCYIYTGCPKKLCSRAGYWVLTEQFAFNYQNQDVIGKFYFSVISMCLIFLSMISYFFVTTTSLSTSQKSKILNKLKRFPQS